VLPVVTVQRMEHGMPYRAGPNCWLYHATKKGTSADGMRFCFTFGRLSVIQTAQLG